MTDLITGAAGLVGSHLYEMLVAEGRTVVATYLNPTIHLSSLSPQLPLVELDVLDREGVFQILDQHRPGVIYHLAAQSLPTVSWVDPWRTLDVNVNGTINIFETIKAIRKSSSYDPVVVVACSSAEYGASMTVDRVPIDEEAPLLPLHPYGVSKVAQDLLAYQYFVNDSIRCVRARIFNCTGPRKRDDAVSDFGRAVSSAMRYGTVVKTGNLSTKRAIIDVRDLVRALHLLAQSGEPGAAYNICAEQVTPMSDVLQLYFDIAGKKFTHEIDAKKLRPSDEPIIYGSSRKLKEDTGWKQGIPLSQTLQDVLDFELKYFEVRG
jgi:GDP-4-dehydro-6-deoxy-D-mannose reductase